ncbi:MAG: hypothetical protein KJI69_05770 [Patescibacteria group bacterium]|nr:hypothetical protein [Patescibacteria group bacterium]
MADFNQAIQWLKEGKEVRRESWKGKFTKGYKPNYKDYRYSLEDFEATDWEIYCEEHKWVSYDDIRPTYLVRDHCKNCGVEKSENPKTLKDLQKDYEWRLDTYNAVKQEAIKDIKSARDGCFFCFVCNKFYKGYDGSKNIKEHIDKEHKIMRFTEDVETYIKWKFNITDEDLQ